MFQIRVDNRYVVPYNSFLLNKYECHVNVEAVTTVDVVKYIYKYIYKVFIFSLEINSNCHLQGVDKALGQFIEASEIDDGADGQLPGTTVHMKKDGQIGSMAPRGVFGTQKQWADMNDRINEEMRKVYIIFI